jgi:hypothetical protein
MKKLITLLALVMLSLSHHAQLATVTGGNFGASLTLGSVMNKPEGTGFGGDIGLTTSFFEVVFPTVTYGIESASFGLDSSGSDLISKSHYLGFGVNNKVPVGSISMGKSSKYECWYLNLKLLLDFNYRLRLNNTSSFDFVPRNETGLNLGLGVRPSFSGADKSRVAWAFFYDVYYHMDLNKSDQPVLGTTVQQNGIYFRFTFLHYKTSDMLGSGSKKKAYNRKY